MLFVRRAAAYIVDIALLFGVLFPLGWLAVLVLNFSPGSGLQIWQATLLNFSLPAWLYFTLSDSLWGGQTLGKRWFKLKVTGSNSQPPGVLRALLRTAIKLLPWELAHVGGFALEGLPVLQWTSIGLSNLLIVAYLLVLIPTHGQRSLHDIVARTQVQQTFKR